MMGLTLPLPLPTSSLTTSRCSVLDGLIGNAADAGLEFVRVSPFVIGFARPSPVFGLDGAGAATNLVHFAFTVAVGFDAEGAGS